MATVLYASPPSPFGDFPCDPDAAPTELTAATFWNWTWEPWSSCEAHVDHLNAKQCKGWLELQTVNQVSLPHRRTQLWTPC